MKHTIYIYFFFICIYIYIHLHPKFYGREGILSNAFSKRASSYTIDIFSLEDKAETSSSINLSYQSLVATRRSDELFRLHGRNSDYEKDDYIITKEMRNFALSPSKQQSCSQPPFLRVHLHSICCIVVLCFTLCSLALDFLVEK